MFTRAIATVSALGVALFVCAPCEAIPIFAQRYLLTCKTCHTVLPELNAFGNSFRDHGYRLPGNPPVHGTTIVALRYNVVYQSDPPPGTRRYTPNGVILANADIGAITAYLHYNLGAGGGPGQPFLGYLAYYSKASQTLFRLGLFELPLTHSPEQRLDTSVPYGYEALTVGQNNLTMIEPRLGLEAERVTGATRISAEIAPGNFQGAAYGGAPINDGTRTSMG
ncbi:MAG TPA: hypothetical protein VKG44_05695, partial [Candidatus Baltobacteraceae bacterium]|nr:hypothetical protein [Candidatus Baltobacteraceae bacterium]